MIIKFSNQSKVFNGPKWIKVDRAARILFNIKRIQSQIEIALLLEQQSATVSVFRFGMLSQKYEFGHGMHEIGGDEVTGGFFVEIKGISAIAVLGGWGPTKTAGRNVLGYYWVEPVPCGPYSTPIFSGSIQESS